MKKINKDMNNNNTKKGKKQNKLIQIIFWVIIRKLFIFIKSIYFHKNNLILIFIEFNFKSLCPPQYFEFSTMETIFKYNEKYFEVV